MDRRAGIDDVRRGVYRRTGETVDIIDERRGIHDPHLSLQVRFPDGAVRWVPRRTIDPVTSQRPTRR